jgi:putative aldouronate transport system permease protein
VSSGGTGLRGALRRDRLLYLLLIPGLVYFVVFHYLPMYGIVIAFQDYSIFKGFAGSRWVGFGTFSRLFSMFGFSRAFTNTIIISLLKLLFGFPMPIILALLLNEVTHLGYRKAVQTAIFLPHFISWVVIAALLYTLLSPSSGILKAVLTKLGYQGAVVNLMGDKQYFRPLLVATHVWREAGFGSIVYIAAISGVDPELYDAASVDGAGKWRKLWHVTLACIRTTIVMLFILRLGALLNAGFEQIFAMYNPLVYEVSEILDTYVYKIGIVEAQFSLATATGLFKSAIALCLVLGANALSRRIDPDSALF